MNIQIGNNEQDDYEHIRLYGEHLRREEQRRIDAEKRQADKYAENYIKFYAISLAIWAVIILLFQSCK